MELAVHVIIQPHTLFRFQSDKDVCMSQ